MELDTQRSIATGNVARGANRNLARISISDPSSCRGRLDDEIWIAVCEKGNDRLPPTAMMRKLDDVGVWHRDSFWVARNQTRSGNSLNITSQEQ